MLGLQQLNQQYNAQGGQFFNGPCTGSGAHAADVHWVWSVAWLSCIVHWTDPPLVVSRDRVRYLLPLLPHAAVHEPQPPQLAQQFSGHPGAGSHARGPSPPEHSLPPFVGGVHWRVWVPPAPQSSVHVPHLDHLPCTGDGTMVSTTD